MENIYTFDGHWNFKIQLPIFKEYFCFKSFGDNLNFREELNIVIFDLKDDNPDPFAEQISAINYIIYNQKSILDSIYNSIINTIFPLHRTLIDETEYFFPKIESLNDLKKILGLDEIVIYTQYKDGLSYTGFRFEDYSGDPEHGLFLIIHKDRVIDIEEDLKKIYDDMGLNYLEIQKQENLDYEEKLKQPLKFHLPNPKYNKLKPWQADENNYYPFGLLHKNQLNEFILFLESKYATGLNYGGLLSVAKHYGYKEIINILESKK